MQRYTQSALEDETNRISSQRPLFEGKDYPEIDLVLFKKDSGILTTQSSSRNLESHCSIEVSNTRNNYKEDENIKLDTSRRSLRIFSPFEMREDCKMSLLPPSILGRDSMIAKDRRSPIFLGYTQSNENYANLNPVFSDGIALPIPVKSGLFSKRVSEQTVNQPLSSLSLSGPQNVMPVDGTSFTQVSENNMPTPYPPIGKDDSLRTRASHLAYGMIETNRLDLKSYGDLTLEEKTFLSNIVNIRHPDVVIDPDQDLDSFVDQINSKLGQPQTKRNDDRLRWIFKRFIRHTLCKMTPYKPSKLHRREDYMATLTNYYFPLNPELEEDLLNSTFASKKKLRKLFCLSPLFKNEFFSFVNSQIETLHETESIGHFESIFDYMIETLKTNPEVTKIGFVRERFKRLDWRKVDVQDTVRQINGLVKKFGC